MIEPSAETLPARELQAAEISGSTLGENQEAFGAIASYSQLAVNELQLRLNGQEQVFDLSHERVQRIYNEVGEYKANAIFDHLIFVTIDHPATGMRSCRTISFGSHQITEITHET